MYIIISNYICCRKLMSRRSSQRSTTRERDCSICLKTFTTSLHPPSSKCTHEPVACDSYCLAHLPQLSCNYIKLLILYTSRCKNSTCTGNLWVIRPNIPAIQATSIKSSHGHGHFCCLLSLPCRVGTDLVEAKQHVRKEKRHQEKFLKQ